MKEPAYIVCLGHWDWGEQALSYFQPIAHSKVQNSKDWMNESVKKSIYEKNAAYNIFKMNQEGQNWHSYTSKRNSTTNAIRKSKSKYLDPEIDNVKSDSKLMWQIMKKS